MPPRSRPPGALVAYLRETQKSSIGHITRLTPYRRGETLALDEMTRRSLELTRTLRDGKREGSLLAGDRPDRHADGCPAPGRLAHVAVDPSRRDRRAARRRRRAGPRLRACGPTCATSLGQAYDLERLAARVGTGRATPRDLVALARTLALLPRIKARLAARGSKRLAELEAALELCPEVRAAIEAALVDDPPLALKEGGLIRDGLSPRPRRAPRDRPRRQVVDRPVPGRAGPADRHRQPQGRLQQGLRLLHRDHARAGREGPGRLHPQADRQERRALHHARAEGVRGQGPPRRGPRLRARIRAVRHPARPRRGRGAPADPGRRGAGAGRRPRVLWPSWPSGRATAGRRSSPSPSSRSRRAAIRCSTR